MSPACRMRSTIRVVVSTPRSERISSSSSSSSVSALILRPNSSFSPVVHVAFPQGTPLVGNYARAKLWIWSDVALAMTDSNEDDFKKRLIAVLASCGGAFGVLQPKAFCEIV